MTYSDTEKAAIVCLLIELINADEKVTLDEQYIFSKICGEIAVTQDIFNAGKNMDVKYAMVVVKHMTDEQKMDVAVMMARIIDADGADDKEIKMLNQICLETGLDMVIHDKVKD